MATITLEGYRSKLMELMRFDGCQIVCNLTLCFGLEIVRWACARLGVAAPPTVAKTEFATGKIVNRAAPPPRGRVAAVSRVGIQRTCCADLNSVRAPLCPGNYLQTIF
ncbi:unnamed protein product [Spodoptera exigua]|nr:unnamed protein product [Spodoptera exigua]